MKSATNRGDRANIDQKLATMRTVGVTEDTAKTEAWGQERKI